MKICALIAAYNEKERIGQLILQIREVEGISDVIVVDDGSVDNTYEEAKKAGAIVLRHEKNKGKGAALRTGFSYIKSKDYGAVITLDGDGQHKYSEISNFIEAYKKGDADIVVGSRMLARHRISGGMQCKDLPSSKKQAGMPFIRYATNHFTSFITSVLSRSSVSDSQSGFRLISTDALKKIELSTSNFEIESEVIIKAARKGFKIKEIPISTVYLAESTKRSKINPFIDTLRFFRFVLKNL
ncbi:MAG: glycosyltransferase family 2 protein [Candidatus Omnitrophica bacterium]|nr:glycosyltransferase family 2 protein [Candidatus Omnitrophota bacterium]